MVTKTVRDVLQNVQELKSFDTGLAQTVSSTGTLTKLTTVPQGDTDSARDGDQLLIKKFEVRGYCTPADATNICRFLIFRWNVDDTSDAPTLAEILQDAASSPWISPYNRDSRRSGKVVIIYDNILGVCTSGPGIKTFKHECKWKALKINFEAAATTGVGHIYLLTVSDSTASTHPFFSMESRVWFTDS